MSDPLDQIQAAILHDDSLVTATFSGVQHGHTLAYRKVVIRPVLLKETRHLQFSYFDAKRDITKNYLPTEAVVPLADVLALPFRNMHVVLANVTLQMNYSKKGKPIFSRHTSDTPQVADLTHDREKHRIFMEGQSYPFLQAIGIMTQDGRVKADQRRKFNQINEFIRVLHESDALPSSVDRPLEVVDFGCGNAALTFATHYYLTQILNLSVHTVGVDIKGDLIARHRQTAAELGWQDIEFVESYIADYRTERPADMVIALHACDTATDDALAQGLRWQSQIVVCAPCCHHHLQAQLDAQPTPPLFAPVMRYGLLHERMGDVLTDTLRALLLRQAGYKVDVIQFVAPEHTPKNLMLRAVKVAEHGEAQVFDEYAALCDYWQVTPYLAERLPH